MNKDYFLPISILVAAVLVAGAVIYTAGISASSGNQPSDEPVVVDSDVLNINDSDVVLGELSAPVTIIEYSDFQCPFCGIFFSQTVSRLKSDYVASGKVKFVYRHFPFLGPESKAAANAVECAKDQGRFWSMHDEVFNEEISDGVEHNENLNEATFMRLAKDIGLNTTEYKACLDSQKYSSKVNADYAGAQTVGVRATPTIFVNGEKIEGALPFDQFKILIEKYLAK